ncbi:MAG: serine/threonine protein kinase [Pseudonocardia sp.]|nr:serine/threonine protein kinase [Pseudonocardia sp.]OJY48687.1 MAG: hypothetical protein BGP03_05220 [Pseudonocardia sp. 73-21]
MPETDPDGPAVLGHGDRIAPGYRVLEHLNRGNDYDTYDAWSDARFARCLVKTLRPDAVDDRSARRHLLLEGRLLTTLTHPHLVRGYELIRPPRPQPPVLVLETLAGATLGHVLDDMGQRLPLGALGHLGRHLCSVVRYLHGYGYLHMDIKPGNIISNGGRAQLIDLSLARPPGPSSAGNGTPAYMSPEQARGGDLGPPVDVWGVGLVLYEAATLHQPFARGPHSRAVSGSCTRPADRPGERYPQLVRRAPRVRARRRLPRPVAEVIDACLSGAAGDRPTLAELDRVLGTVT